MALLPSNSFERIGTGPQNLEVYLCPTCPFSARITRSLNENVLPLITKGGKYEGKLSLIPRIYPQPFHYMAQVEAEALVYIGAKYNLYWEYLLAIYDGLEGFRNPAAQTLTIMEARDKLFQIALPLLEKSGQLKGPASPAHGAFMDALEASKHTDVLNMVKYDIKIGRQNGIHVTPTVVVDGLRDDNVSSSWGKTEWEEYLGKKVVA